MSQHPFFQPPDDLDVPIWRYVDLESLIAILDGKRLFFPRANLLGDPFEGSLPSPTVSSREALFRKSMASSPAEFRESVLLDDARLYFLQRQWTFVSCWHMNEYESAAMWSLYKNQVAIRSTYRKLRTQLSPQFIHIGVVHYIDYSRETIPLNNAFWPYVCKRKSFEHERELRAMFADVSCLALAARFGHPQTQAGREIAIDPGALIDAIVVSPGTPPWKTHVIRNVVSKFGINRPVVQSAMDGAALY